MTAPNAVTARSSIRIEACFNDALKVTGKLMTVEKVMKAVLRDRPYFRITAGLPFLGATPFFSMNLPWRF